MLDQADPFMLEAFMSKTEQELYEIHVRESRMRDIYISQNKSLVEIDRRIKQIDALIRLRFLNKSLKEMGDDVTEGFSVV